MISAALEAGRKLALGRSLKQTYSLLNRLEMRRKTKAKCKAGCAWCCYIPVECTAEEYALAASLAPPRDVPAGPFAPCPFLNRKSRTCDIYPYRPIACRGYNSLSKLKCERAHRKRIEHAKISSDGEIYWFYRGVASAYPGQRKLLTEWRDASTVGDLRRRDRDRDGRERRRDAVHLQPV